MTNTHTTDAIPSIRLWADTIARAVFAHESLREHLVTRVVNDECSSLCRVNAQPVSMFRNLTTEHAETFNWSECVAELEAGVPTLCDPYSQSVRQPQQEEKRV